MQRFAAVAHEATPEEDKLLRDLFASIDTNCNDTIDFDELTNVLRKADPSITSDAVCTFVESHNLDKCKGLSFDEFKRIMCSYLPSCISSTKKKLEKKKSVELLRPALKTIMDYSKVELHLSPLSHNFGKFPFFLFAFAETHSREN